MDHLRRLDNHISVPIQTDESGFTGRECPQAECEGYFKVEFGTGLKGEGLPCNCPYCGHSAGHNQFWTKEQVEYAKSVAMRQFTDALHKDLKNLEFDHKPKGAFGIGISMKVKTGRQTPIHHYREKELETEIVCVNCTLRYAVYGVFAFCPDCGQHNSLQILDKNLELVGKMLDLAVAAEKDLAESLTANALEDCVSAFDGFGREFCRVHAQMSTDPAKAARMSFQSLDGAKNNIVELFGIDLCGGLVSEEWNAAVRGFQKRHLLAHKMGVVDDEYARKSGDAYVVVGRKVSIGVPEVRELVRLVGKLGRHVSGKLQELKKKPRKAPLSNEL